MDGWINRITEKKTLDSFFVIFLYSVYLISLTLSRSPSLPLFLCPTHSHISRDDQKPSVSSGTAKAGHTDIDGSLFHRNGTKADGTRACIISPHIL